MKTKFGRLVIIKQYVHKGFFDKQLVRNNVKINLKEYSIKPHKRNIKAFGLY